MADVPLGGCAACSGSDRPGYVIHWFQVGDHMRSQYKRCPKQCTPQSRAEAIARAKERRAQQQASEHPAPPTAVPADAPDRTAAPVRHAAAPRPAPLYRGRPAVAAPRRTPSRPASTSASAQAPRRWPAIALDATADGWTLDVDQMPPPAGPRLTDWMAWLGTGLPLRVDRAHAAGRAGDGMICLTEAAVKALGLPAALPTTDKTLAKLRDKIAKAAAGAGMEISDELGPTFYAFRRKGSPGGPKTSVRIVVTPWLGQGSDKQQATAAMTVQLATNPDGQLDATTLARRIRTFVTDLGITPGVTPATTGMLLFDAVRPRTEWIEDPGTGEWKAQLRDGALPAGDTTVPPAAGARHPKTLDLLAKNEALCEEEDYKWWARHPTDDEAALPYAVAVDVCASYLSVTESLRLPAGELTYVTNPQWDAKTAGLWHCDFTTVETEELLPHPATFHGRPPQGPGWYATPTVAYMVTEYAFDPSTITDAYLSTHTVPVLKEWTGRLRQGYKRAYSDLGLTDGLDPQEFLDAYAVHKQVDRDDTVRHDALVLATLYKNIYKGGIGKWADSGRTSHPDDEAWLEKIVASWSYRPELRFHVIAAARIAGHRRMRKTYRITGKAPFAINVDQALYAAASPSPLELLPPHQNGKPVPGALRLGIAPGSYKHEASVPMSAVADLMNNSEHPTRLTHDYATDGTPLPGDTHRARQDDGTQDEEGTR
ncbi:hypothetical protein [Streptomyces luteireticuli]|uniref:hypothetical protein n=1 Tax=Streptomyces luteireticuli TaxID=173858 RepID=UPI0035585635